MNMVRYLCLMAMVVGLAPAAHGADGENEASAYEFASAVYTYTCSDGTGIKVAYINIETGLSLAVVRVADELLVMENVISGSGARYATVLGEERFVWWSHQNEGFLQKGPDGEERMMHTACR